MREPPGCDESLRICAGCLDEPEAERDAAWRLADVHLDPHGDLAVAEQPGTAGELQDSPVAKSANSSPAHGWPARLPRVSNMLLPG
jgi:hypothetical protein